MTTEEIKSLQEEITHHKMMKKTDMSYPKLPKAMPHSIDKNTVLNKHLLSCLRGFYGRLSNWEKATQITLNNI